MERSDWRSGEDGFDSGRYKLSAGEKFGYVGNAAIAVGVVSALLLLITKPTGLVNTIESYAAMVGGFTFFAKEVTRRG